MTTQEAERFGFAENWLWFLEEVGEERIAEDERSLEARLTTVLSVDGPFTLYDAAALAAKRPSVLFATKALTTCWGGLACNQFVFQRTP